MKIQDGIKRLDELGRMPDESEDNLSSERIDLYASLLGDIEKPVNEREASILIRLFPESGLFGVEWSLLHLFETVFSEIDEDKYIQLISECPSKEWRDTLTKRLENKKENQE